MTRKDMHDAYETITPTRKQKEKMLDAILSAVNDQPPVRKDYVMKKHTRKPLLVAATIAMAMLLAGCAAAVAFGLQDLKIAERPVPEPNPVASEPGETPAPATRDIISLQGFAGSPSFQATKEWLDFEEAYDPDHALMTAADNAGYRPPEAYLSYNCYTQEMIDKIDAICETYHLKPLGKMWVETKHEKLFELLGIPGITASNPGSDFRWLSGYYFETGTFAIEVDAALDGAVYELQYRCSMKDSLDYVYLNVGDIEDYQQWEHTMTDGTTVLLALSTDKALILADRDAFFVSINILNPEGMTRKTLEALASSFDFSYQSPKVDPAKADARQAEEEAEFLAEQEALKFDAEASYNQTFRKPSYAQFLRELDDFEDGSYVLRDVTGDGMEELVLIRDSKYVIEYGGGNQKIYACKECLVMTMKPDGLTDRILTGAYDLYEGDVFGDSVEYDDTMDYWTRMYFRVGTDAGFDQFGDWTIIDKVQHSLPDGGSWTWSRSQDGDDICELTITEAEAWEIMESYNPADLDWKPVSEFPMD